LARYTSAGGRADPRRWPSHGSCPRPALGLGVTVAGLILLVVTDLILGGFRTHIGTGTSLVIIAAVITTVTLTSLLAAGRRTRPEKLSLPDGSRSLRTQRGLPRGMATGAYSARGAAGPGETAVPGRPDLMCG
jgi:hypothetical protein